MTAIDKALALLNQDRHDSKAQSEFYDTFLNSTFFIPTMDDDASGAVEEGHAVPLVLEADGNDYLLLFDTEERLRQWAQARVSFVEVPGHVIAEMSTPPLHWALNVGCEHNKQFLPEEIAWLQEVVERCDAQAGKEQA